MWNGGLEKMQRRRNSEHWVCFDCRKMFRKVSRWGTHIEGLPHECPECKQPMRDMGIYFEPPRRNDIDAWKRLELLASRGFTFHSEGSKAYIKSFIFNVKRPSVRNLRATLEARAKEQEADEVAYRSKQLKKAKASR
jgi:hypothetical protein